ncbi:MAG: FAD-dependent oxidoreductase, partial [Myxococcota bacterium]
MDSSQSPTVLVVGSGITGLMTAWEAVRAGFSVTLVSQSPDPRLAKAHESQLSSTYDSPNDQRYITLFEGHPYLELEGYITQMYPGMGDAFASVASDGGVLSRSEDQFRPEAQQWLASR